MWQDWAIAIIQLAIAISFLPTVFHPTHKPALWTCVLTSSCVFGITAIYFTLQFWFAMTMAGTIATLWAIVGVQRYRLNRRNTSMN